MSHVALAKAIGDRRRWYQATDTICPGGNNAHTARLDARGAAPPMWRHNAHLGYRGAVEIAAWGQIWPRVGGRRVRCAIFDITTVKAPFLLIMLPTVPFRPKTWYTGSPNNHRLIRVLCLFPSSLLCFPVWGSFCPLRLFLCIFSFSTSSLYSMKSSMGSKFRQNSLLSVGPKIHLNRFTIRWVHLNVVQNFNFWSNFMIRRC